jgi:3-methyladenine DNA glycosylase AlkD
LILFERWLNNYINNWAKCDTLCNHAIGSFYRTLFTIHLHP